MAKRGRPTADNIAFDKSNGYFKVNIGKELRVDGKMVSKKFYLDTHEYKARIKKAHIVVEWEKIVASGGTHWTEEAYYNLEQAGAILPRKATLRRDDALAMVTEPLTTQELKPFQNDKGAIDVAQGAALIQLSAQKFMSLPQVRGALWNEWMAAIKCGRGWALVKEFVSTFGLSNETAKHLLFNVHGNVSVANPIGYDATAKTAPDKEQELKDAGILKGEDGDTV